MAPVWERRRIHRADGGDFPDSRCHRRPRADSQVPLDSSWTVSGLINVRHNDANIVFIAPRRIGNSYEQLPTVPGTASQRHVAVGPRRGALVDGAGAPD